MPEPLEWVIDKVGEGDGACIHFTFSASRRPIEDGTLEVIVAANAVDLIAAVGGSAPAKKHNVTFHGSWGPVDIHFDPSNAGYVPQPGESLYIRYAWRPPRLRDAEVLVRLPGREPEWVSMDELRDAIQRGWR